MYASQLEKDARQANQIAPLKAEAQEAGENQTASEPELQAMSNATASDAQAGRGTSRPTGKKGRVKPKFRPLAEVDPERYAAQEAMEKRIVELGNPPEALYKRPENLKEIDQLLTELAVAAEEDNRARVYRKRMKFVALFAPGCHLAALVPA